MVLHVESLEGRLLLSGISIQFDYRFDTDQFFDSAKKGVLEDASVRVDAMARELDVVLAALPAVWQKMSGESFPS